MQSFALSFAISLLGLGALLNTVVLAYFIWRVYRAIGPQHARRSAWLARTLAAGHQ